MLTYYLLTTIKAQLLWIGCRSSPLRAIQGVARPENRLQVDDKAIVDPVDFCVKGDKC